VRTLSFLLTFNTFTPSLHHHSTITPEILCTLAFKFSINAAPSWSWHNFTWLKETLKTYTEESADDLDGDISAIKHALKQSCSCQMMSICRKMNIYLHQGNQIACTHTRVIRSKVMPCCAGVAPVIWWCFIILTWLVVSAKSWNFIKLGSWNSETQHEMHEARKHLQLQYT
jgi:hypothetical protein